MNKIDQSDIADVDGSQAYQEELAAFLKARNRALEMLDMDFAVKMMPKAAPEVRLMAMHKARYECTEISREARRQSAAWMREHDVRRLDGSEPLPEGELPE